MKDLKKTCKRFLATVLSMAMLLVGFAVMPSEVFGDSVTVTAYADVATNQTLRKGSRGTAVKQLQQSLNTLGYNCGTPDGIYGNNTYNAVRRFQSNNGLTVDGIAGYKTLTTINNKLHSRSVKLNKQKLLNYAATYWNKRNYSYNYYNNNNCANFVSQCLVAAGMPTNNTFKNGTAAFVYVPNLKSYLMNNYNVKYISKPSAGNIQVGDILYTSSGHVMVVTAKSGNNIYATGNTNNRYNLKISSNYFYAVLKTSELMN